MVKIDCDLNEVHASALMTLIDRLDYETLAACSHTVQETYDMIMALQRLNIAVKDGVYPQPCARPC